MSQPLTPAVEKYILHWGEMGARWGVNRTVAQIHALIYLSPEPITAEQISATLSLARSTVSTGLRELQSWGLIRIAHVLGDRRDHFETFTDVWEMFRLVLDERKRREMDPTLDLLQEVIAEMEAGETDDEETRARIEAMYEFFHTMVTLYTQTQSLPLEAVKGIARSGKAVQRLRSLVGGQGG